MRSPAWPRRSAPSVAGRHLEHAAKAPSELSLMHLFPIDGAVHRVRRNETAWNQRQATWSMVIAGIDPDPAKAGALTAWAKGYWEAVHPYTLGGAYVNFMMEEGEDRISSELWRKLRPSGRHQEQVRPDQLLPREPEHQAGLRRLTTPAQTRATLSAAGGAVFAGAYGSAGCSSASDADRPGHRCGYEGTLHCHPEPCDIADGFERMIYCVKDRAKLYSTYSLARTFRADLFKSRYGGTRDWPVGTHYD